MPVTSIKIDQRARERPCLRCGYSLRRLADANRCPECGLPVWLTLNQNDTLELSNPDWLRRMSAALWVMAVVSIVSLVCLVPVSYHTFRLMQYRQEYYRALRAARNSADDPNAWASVIALRRKVPLAPQRHLVQMYWMVGAAAFAAKVGAIVVLTSVERRYPDRLRSMRLAARVLAGLAAVAVLMIFSQMFRPTVSAVPEWAVRLVSVGAAVLSWSYLRALARRIPHKRLSRVATWMSIVPGVSLFYSFIRDSDWPPDVIPLLYLPAAAVLFLWFARALRQAARIADTNWAAPVAS
jgi:hypothetical protein